MRASKVIQLCTCVVLLSMVTIACSQKNENTMLSDGNWDKMDTALRSELRSNVAADSDALVVVFAEVIENSDAHAAELEAMGIQVQTRTGSIWTLRGNAASLVQASGKEFINRMELSQQRRIP